MKKLYSITFALFIALSFSGCLFWGNTDTPLVYEDYQGTLKSLGGIKVSDNATHILQTEDGEILYVYSDTYNLNDDKYLGNVIEIYGAVTEASEKGKDVVNISKITVVEEQKDTAEAVVGETYSDQYLGFSWEVKSDWQVDKGVGDVAFILPVIGSDDDTLELDAVENDYFAVKLFENTDELPLDEWLANYDPSGAEIAVASSVGKDFLKSLKITSEMGDVEIYYVERSGGFVYEVSHYNFDIDNRTYFRNLFYDALATFQVIPFGDETVDTTSAEPASSSNSQTTSYDKIMGYIQNSFSPVAEYEFVNPDYVYVTYTDGEDEVRVLLQYSTDSGFDYDVLATFEPGTVTDWELVSGEDEASGLPKSLIQTSDEGGTSVVEIMDGYRYFESGPYEFTIQYPDSWYYSGGGGHYSFSDTAEGDELIGLDVLDYSVSSASGTSVTLENGKQAKKTSGGVYVDRDNSSCYYVNGSSEYSDVILNMAGSIVDSY